MKLRKNTRFGGTIVIIQLALELAAISYHLIAGNLNSITARDSMGSGLFMFSILLTPIAALFTFSQFSVRQFFKEWNQMLYASFRQLPGTKATIRYLFQEGRLPFLVMLYLLHFCFDTGFLNCLSDYRVLNIGENPNYLVGRAVLNYLFSLGTLILLILLVKRKSPLKRMPPTEHTDTANFYFYLYTSFRPNPYQRVKALVNTYFQKNKNK